MYTVTARKTHSRGTEDFQYNVLDTRLCVRGKNINEFHEPCVIQKFQLIFHYSFSINYNTKSIGTVNNNNNNNK